MIELDWFYFTSLTYDDLKTELYFLSNLKPINDWAGLVLFYFATYDDLKPEL